MEGGIDEINVIAIIIVCLSSYCLYLYILYKVAPLYSNYVDK
jgi:hypothetical protein